MATRKKSRATKSSRSFEADHVYSVVFHAERIEDLAAIVSNPAVDVGCRHPVFGRDDAGVHVCVLLRGRALEPLLAETRLRTEVVADQTIASRAALKLVARGDRFRRGAVVPRGAGRLV